MQTAATKGALQPKPKNYSWLVPLIAVLIFAFMPLYAGRSTLNMFTNIFCLGVFAMSYDLLLGYTGILSFGHAMFFGIGGYAVGIIVKNTAPSIQFVVLAFLGAIAISILLSLLIGFLSLRVRDTYYAMITMAFGELFVIAADRARHLTNGEDGLTFAIPPVFRDRILYFYVVLAFAIISFYLLWRFTNSPTGRVMVAIRENEQRVKFLGLKTLNYKLISTVVAGVFASLAGGFYAIHMRFFSTTSCNTLVTIDALMATIIGGIGTLYGSVIGMGVIKLSGDYLSRLAKLSPVFDRWPIIFGILYILIVIFAPYGIVGLVYKIKHKITSSKQAKKALEA
ncbi:MAG: branched-chain amino acid ABC transporter permease [Peptococcia bacterium]